MALPITRRAHPKDFITGIGKDSRPAAKKPAGRLAGSSPAKPSGATAEDTVKCPRP